MNFQELIWREPWLTPVILNIEHIIKTDAVPTAAVSPNGKALYYNPCFWKNLSRKEKIGVQLHELLHIVNLHTARRNYRIFRLWNIACDKTINYQILSSGYVLPQNALEGENDTAEHIYEKLRKIKVNVNINGKNSNSSPYISSFPHKNGHNPPKSVEYSGNSLKEGRRTPIAMPSKIKDICTQKNDLISDRPVILADDLLKVNEDGSENANESETVVAVEAAVKFAGAGATPLSKQFVPFPAVADWRYVLHSFVKSAVGDEFDYLSYEFDEFGVCEDILSPIPRPRICVLMDESGSIEDMLYHQFLGELKKIDHYADVFVSGFSWDTELNAVPVEKYHRTMSGGTDVRRAYHEACKQSFDGIVILTDGYLEFPAHEPIPTVWAMSRSCGRKREVLL